MLQLTVSNGFVDEREDGLDEGQDTEVDDDNHKDGDNHSDDNDHSDGDDGYTVMIDIHDIDHVLNYKLLPYLALLELTNDCQCEIGKLI